MEKVWENAHRIRRMSDNCSVSAYQARRADQFVMSVRLLGLLLGLDWLTVARVRLSGLARARWWPVGAWRGPSSLGRGTQAGQQGSVGSDAVLAAIEPVPCKVVRG